MLLSGYRYNKAINSYNQVIAKVDKYGYSESLKSSSLQGLGNAYSGKKDYPNAIKAFTRWIEHLKVHGHENEADYAKAYERLATAEKFNHDYDASIADFETAITLYEKLGMANEAEQALNGLRTCRGYANKEPGNIVENAAAEQQRSDKILEVLRSSINSLEQGGDYLGNLSKARTLATIAGSYALTEDYDNAVDYYAQYINTLRPALIEDFLLKNPKERELTWKQELFNITSMNTLILDIPDDKPELYERLSGLIYDGQLLSKGILLSSNIEFEKVLNRYGTPEMSNQYQQIKDNLAGIEKMKQEHRSTEEIQSKVRETDALQLALAKESATKGVFTDFIKYTSKDVVNALHEDEVAIEFVTLESGVLPRENIVAAVILTKELPTGITIPICSVEDIDSMTADNKKFSNEDYTAMIWGYIIGLIPNKKKIYFAPDGVLNNIGIEYLSINGIPINEMIGISRLSSTREICREHTDLPMQYAALFGDIDYFETSTKVSDKSKYSKTRGIGDIGFLPLENAEREINEIDAILKQNIATAEIFKYTKDEASKAEFLSQDEIPLNLLHVITHGDYIDSGEISDDDAMSRSLLAFAGANNYDEISENEAIVTAAEIADMSLQDCQLVVLSACKSGVGKLGNDGVFGLQRGFKNAGAKTLLVSLKEVKDDASADIMISFYRHLVKPGITRQEALKKAQAENRAKYPDDDTWASFILIDSFN